MGGCLKFPRSLASGIFPVVGKCVCVNNVPCYLFHMKATPLNFWILLYNDYEFFDLICESLIMRTLLVVRNTHLHMSARKRACSASVAIGILNLTTAPCILCLLPQYPSPVHSARTSIEEQIERSKSHWSEPGEWDSDEVEVAEISNVEVFNPLQTHPRWGGFFMPFGKGHGRSLVVREKFAEGGQAELYHAQVTWSTPEKDEDDLKYGRKHVVKVFRKGTHLKHLQAHWPKGFLEHQAEAVEPTKLDTFFRVMYVYDVIFGTLLEDGGLQFLCEGKRRTCEVSLTIR